jgi:acetyl esterase/lipase
MGHAVFRARRLLSGLTVAVLLTGCASGTVAPSAPAGSPTPLATPHLPTATATPEASASPAVAETDDITYAATGPLMLPAQVDVYAPTKPGLWPVVVMFHGWGLGTVTKADYAAQASHVAAEGFVVFVANWGPASSTAAPDGVPTPAQWETYTSEGACAVAFAESHAKAYGGDPGSLILFGHSGGAGVALAIASTHPAPTSGCPGGTSVGPVHGLVTWDGDWTLTDPGWDKPLAADPSVWDALTPFSTIASDRTLKVVMLASGIVGEYVRDLSDPKAFDAFFKVRGPSGVLHRQLEAIGALDDKAYDIQEIQRLLLSLLKAQGNPVTLTMLPGTSHDSYGSAMGDEAMSVFVTAFKEAAGG